jgi:hypothetical protein
MRCGAKEHRVPNDQTVLGQKQPLASNLLVLLLDKTGMPLRDLFAFHRVVTELFGSGLHLLPSISSVGAS